VREGVFATNIASKPIKSKIFHRFELIRRFKLDNLTLLINGKSFDVHLVPVFSVSTNKSLLTSQPTWVLCTAVGIMNFPFAIQLALQKRSELTNWCLAVSNSHTAISEPEHISVEHNKPDPEES
jgi:hypothetical protein